MHFEQATLLFDFAVIDGQPHLATPLTVLDQKGNVQRPKLGSGDPVDAFAAELREVVRSVRTGKSSEILSGGLACDALVLCQKQTQSVVSGRPMKI